MTRSAFTDPNEVSATKRSIVLRAIYATCFAWATIAHLYYEFRYGVLLNGLLLDMPLASRAYFASLTLLDPLASVLLFVRPRAGLILCVMIMVTDVLNNAWVLYHFRLIPNAGHFLLSGFLLFLLGTVRYAWQGSPSDGG